MKPAIIIAFLLILFGAIYDSIHATGLGGYVFGLLVFFGGIVMAGVVYDGEPEQINTIGPLTTNLIADKVDAIAEQNAATQQAVAAVQQTLSFIIQKTKLDQ